LSWGLSAPGLWAHDIGGFYGDGPSPELYVRWAQVGCLSPLTRFHGLGPREPWAFGSEAERIVTAAIELRYRLLPYLVSVAEQSAGAGLPVMRPLVLEFPDDPSLALVEHEFLLGRDLLVVAVLDDGPGPAATTVVLPPGRWYEWFTGAMFDGPARLDMDVPLDRFPLFVRAGSVLPLGPPGRCTSEIPRDEWELHVVPGPPRTTEVHDGGRIWRYRPVIGEGGGIEAVVVEEPALRARSAVVHLDSGRTVTVPLRT
jgi:alpha-D-xyloside xylohydrolase